MYRIMVWTQDGKWEQVFADYDFRIVHQRYVRYEVRPGFTKHLFHEIDHSQLEQE